MPLEIRILGVNQAMAYLKGRERAMYVNGMFTRIAARYDLMNQLMSLGQHNAWRRTAIQAANLGPQARILDVATGTGDVLIQALRQHPDATAVGCDFTFEMMRVGKSKPGAEHVRWSNGDAVRLPYPDNSFDAVTSSFGVRNFVDREAAFREQRRVLKPGGRVICLEMSKPPHNLMRPFFLFYFDHLVPVVGGWISGQPDAYQYLPQSVNNFLTPDEVTALMQRAGLRDVTYRLLMLSTVAIHVGVK